MRISTCLQSCGTLVLFTSACFAVEHVIDMQDNRFVPRSHTINVGDTVVWKNSGRNTHTATGDDPMNPNHFDTQDVRPGMRSRPVTFNTAGTVAYHCVHHGRMKGTLTVRALESGIYGSRFPRSLKQEVTSVQTSKIPPDFNTIYFSADFGRHYLGSKGTGFIIANDFGHNHIASHLKYAGETNDLLIYDIVGLSGAQHAYQKEAKPGEFGVWYRPSPSDTFFFWFYGHREESVIDPPQ